MYTTPKNPTFGFEKKNGAVMTAPTASEAEQMDVLMEKVALAANDLRCAGELFEATVECANAADAVETDFADVMFLTHMQDLAYKDGDALASIADESETFQEIDDKLVALYSDRSFIAGLDAVKDYIRRADKLLNELGISAITVSNDDESSEEFTLYVSGAPICRSMLSSVLDLTYWMAVHHKDVWPNLVACIDGQLSTNLKAAMMRTYVQLNRLKPSNLGLNDLEYMKMLTALVAGAQAAEMIERSAEFAIMVGKSNKSMEEYCHSEEGAEARIAIINAIRMCPVDID